MGKRIIRLFPDWGAPTPLWEDGTAEYNIDPQLLGLSIELSTALRVWTTFWKNHFDPEQGWVSDDSEKEWGEQGHLLEQHLTAELGSDITLLQEWEQ